MSNAEGQTTWLSSGSSGFVANFEEIGVRAFLDCPTK